MKPFPAHPSLKIEETLGELAADAEITFARIAVTPTQITDWQLPTRPTKTSDSRAKNFGDISVELDAIEPDHLRRLVEQAISRHLPRDQLRVLQIAEESEREFLQAWASRVITFEEFARRFGRKIRNGRSSIAWTSPTTTYEATRGVAMIDPSGSLDGNDDRRAGNRNLSLTVCQRGPVVVSHNPAPNTDHSGERSAPPPSARVGQ